MPRNPLPAREVEICKRLAIWRERRGIGRNAFAKEIGLEPNSYGNYEYGKAPLRFDLARKILSTYSINAKWLATGEGPDGVDVPIPSARTLGISPKDLYSSVYDSRLAEDVEKKTQEVINNLIFRPTSISFLDKPLKTGHDRVLLEEALFAQIREWFYRFPDDQLSGLVNQLFHAGFEIEKALPVSEVALESRMAEMEKARKLLHRRRTEAGLSAEP